MAVIAYREVLPRTFSHKFGEPPSAERKFVVTVDEPTPTQTIIGAIGIAHGASHPEYSYLKMLDGQVTEPDRHHAEVTYSYAVPKQEDADENPLARPDVWSFSTGGAAVPALYYYEGDALRPLVNTAGEMFEGLMTEESEMRATIAGNRLQFPVLAAAAVTNCVNKDVYLGCPPYTWKCAGIGGQQQTEVVDGVELRYWSITVELVCRSSGWPLLIPNVGWNYRDGNVLRRAFVLDDEQPPNKIASAAPVALNENGSIRNGKPDILNRRVHPQVTFSQFFGEPTF